MMFLVTFKDFSFEFFNISQIRHLTRKGGRTVPEMIRRILPSIIENKVMQLYSWQGFKGKEKFCQLELKNVIMGKTNSSLLSFFYISLLGVSKVCVHYLTRRVKG